MQQNDESDDQPIKAKRDELMLKAYLLGDSIEEVAKTNNLSVRRVYKIAARDGWAEAKKEVVDRRHVKRAKHDAKAELDAREQFLEQGYLEHPDGRFYSEIRLEIPPGPPGKPRTPDYGYGFTDECGPNMEIVPDPSPDSSDFLIRTYLTPGEVKELKKLGRL